MTKAQLDAYIPEQAELRLLQQKIRDAQRPVHDTVTGSSVDYPYTQHSISVHGVPQERTPTIWADQARIWEIERRAKETEDWIGEIPDSLTRTIFELKVMKDMTYPEIARFIGGKNSEDGIRMRFKRYFEKG